MDNASKASFHTGSLSRRHLSQSRVISVHEMSKAKLQPNSTNTAILANNVTQMQDIFKTLQLQLQKQKSDLEEKAKNLRDNERCP